MGGKLKKNQKILEINGLFKKYREIQALDDVNLEFCNNGCYGILGANGAGKTTLMMIITNLIKKYSGNYYFNLKNDKNYLGFLPENWGFYPHLSSVEHIEFFHKMRTCRKPTTEDIRKNLIWVGLEERFWNMNPKTYSKGMKQRLGIAMAFTGDPKVVILDEPLAHIDPLGRQVILKKIQQYQRTNNALIIMSSHVISEIEQIADYITILDHGKIKANGEFTEISSNSGNNEYDITCIEENQYDLNTFFNDLKNNQQLNIDDIRITKGKILINSKIPSLIKDYLKNSTEKMFLKPTSGFLNKYYSELLEVQ
jgi:ABC-type multidrug transport system ATPase subunit